MNDQDEPALVEALKREVAINLRMWHLDNERFVLFRYGYLAGHVANARTYHFVMDRVFGDIVL